MATLSFDGDSEKEIEEKVRAWIKSIDDGRTGLDPQPFLEQIGRLATTFTKVIQSTAGTVTGGGSDAELAVDLIKFGFELGENAQRAVTEGIELIAPGVDPTGVRRKVEEIRDGIIAEVIGAVLNDKRDQPDE
ncbi:MAG: hypothetical protein HKL82_00985 [Acidimicrobiaceae bacterium]|nr:hypothetical protein [Acidimicrobiaceae bacterium]